MPLPNLAYALIVPFFLFITVPLALFAGFTTMMAFSILTLRVFLVYLELALSLIPSYLLGRRAAYAHYGSGRNSNATTPAYSPKHGNSHAGYGSGAAVTTTSLSPSSSGSSSPTSIASRTATTAATSRRRRARRLSGASTTIMPSNNGATTPIGDGSGLGLIPSVGMDRDFEGVGGWRIGDGRNDGTEDTMWSAINSRLELPGRHHYRTPSGGDGGMVTPGGSRAVDGGWLMMKPRNRSPETSAGTSSGTTAPLLTSATTISPNSSRVRTPTTATAPVGLTFTSMSGAGEGYFPPMPSPRATRNMKGASVAG